MRESSDSRRARQSSTASAELCRDLCNPRNHAVKRNDFAGFHLAVDRRCGGGRSPSTRRGTRTRGSARRAKRGYRPAMEHFASGGDEDDAQERWIIEERPPLREGKVFVDYDERAIIGDNLEAAYVALNEAFRGIWIQKASEAGNPREYWDEADIGELETLTLDASTAVDNAWRALVAVSDAHAAQEEAELDDDE